MDPALHWILRGSLALLFGAAACHKLRDRPRFAATLGDYRLLPASWTRAAAAAVPALEIGVVALLLTPPAGVEAGIAGAALLALYSGAIAVNLARGRRHIDCGCLGPAGRQPLSGGLLTRNAVLGIACLAVAASPLAARGLHWLDAVSIAGGVAVVALLFLAARNLASGWTRLGRTS